MEKYKKILAKDIAIEAGVSEATVSYIINNRKDVKVADATRKKVLQLCNVHNYAPSQLAKSLATGKNNIIGIQFNLLSSSPSRNQLILWLIKDLQINLQLQGYDTLIMPEIAETGCLHIQHNVGGIICIDLAETEFCRLKESYFVPIISVDMLFNDTLFFKIYNDISQILKHSKVLLNTEKLNLILEKRENNAFMETIKSSFASDNLCIFDTINSLELFVKAHQNEFFVIYDEYLAPLCLRLISPQNFVVVTACKNSIAINEQIKQLQMPLNIKAKAILKVLSSSINRTHELEREIKIAPTI